MKSSSLDLIGIHLLANKASNEKTVLAIEFYSNLIRSVANIRKYMKTYFEMTLPKMLVNEHKYLGFIW